MTIFGLRAKYLRPADYLKIQVGYIQISKFIY